MLEQNLLNMKKRTSQIKGEFTDNLTDAISKNFEQFYQIGSQLVAQIDQKDKEIITLKGTLEKYESAHPELKIKMDNGKGKMKTVSPQVKKQGK